VQPGPGVGWETLLAILAEAREATALIGADGRFRYLSPAVRRVLGRDPAARVGASAFENVHPDDVGRVRQAFEELLTTPNGTAELELRGLHADGTYRWLRVVGRNLLHDPRVGAVLASFWSVDEERRAKEALAEREERLRLARQAARLGFWTYDVRNDRLRIEYRTDLAFAIDPVRGATSAEWLEAVHPADREAARGLVEAAFRGDTDTYSCEVRIRERGGGWRGLAIHASVVGRGRSGLPRLVVGTYQDVTDRRLVEERLREVELERRKFESLTVMAAGIAHDFNNLLTAILGNAGIARAALAAGGEAVQALEDIEAAARRAAGLVRQMLDFAGVGEPAQGRCDLNAVAQEAAAIIRGTLGPELRLVLELASEPGIVRGEENALSRVVVNLLTNAREALAGGRGRVTIRTGTAELSAEQLAAEGWTPAGAVEPGRFGIVEVEDTGPGIRAETLGRIFDPFFSTKFAGRGLGLASVLGIVRRHGGGVRVRSTVGIGTCFTVAIPLEGGRGATA